MFVIEDKVALITGGLGGIGRAYAEELLREGAKGVSLVDINSDDEFIKELEEKFGTGKCIIIKADLENIKDFTGVTKDTEGVVINTSSIAGLHAVSFFPTYSATKYGVISLAHSYGSEEHYKCNQIKIMTICPGRTETNFMAQLNYLPENLKDIMSRKLDDFIPQSSDNVGKALIKVLKDGKTGSTWAVEQGKPAQEVDYTTMFNKY